MHGEPVHAVAHLGLGLRNVVGPQPAVHRTPRAAAVVAAEDAGGRDGGEDSPGIVRIQQDRVQAEAARTRLPRRCARVAAQPGQLLPGAAAVLGAEQGGVLDPGVDRVGIGPVRLQVPHPGELPRVRRSVVPLVGAGLPLVAELVTHRVPRASAVVGTLDHLPEPVGVRRRVEPAGIGGGTRHVKHLPSGEVRTVHPPPPARALRGQQERALARAHQDSDRAHGWCTSIVSRISAMTSRTGWRNWCGATGCLPTGPGRRDRCRHARAASAVEARRGPAACTCPPPAPDVPAPPRVPWGRDPWPLSTGAAWEAAPQNVRCSGCARADSRPREGALAPAEAACSHRRHSMIRA